MTPRARVRLNEQTLHRICGEYLEMPGLRLTLSQGQQLFGLDDETSSNRWSISSKPDSSRAPEARATYDSARDRSHSLRCGWRRLQSGQKEDDMAEKQTEKQGELERRAPMTRRDPSLAIGSPFRTLQHLAEEMDRVFDDFGLGRGWLTPRLGRRWLRSPWRDEGLDWETWAPNIDVFQRGSDLVVRADLPGLKKDDIKVDVTDESITIQGERKREHEEEREGIYRSERSYGSFSRVIPLPEGTITDQAKASFDNGVLEIAMPAPPEQVRRGRRVEITEASTKK